MSDQNPTDGTLKAVYQELCNSYRAIDDFRAKLLGLLPLATGGAFLLVGDNLSAMLLGGESVSPEAQGLLGSVGVLGFVITLGLFAYEIFGIKKCGALIEAGKKIEGSLEINGQFNRRPQNVLRIINEPFAAGVIYPAVLAAWTFFALVFANPNAARWVAIIVFVVGFAITLIYDFVLRRRRWVTSM